MTAQLQISMAGSERARNAIDDPQRICPMCTGTGFVCDTPPGYDAPRKRECFDCDGVGVIPPAAPTTPAALLDWWQNR